VGRGGPRAHEWRQDEVRQIGQALGQPLGPARRHVLEDHTVDACDDRLHRGRRGRRLAGAPRGVGEEPLVAAQQRPAAGQRARARGHHLDHRQRGERRLRGEDPQQRTQAAPDALWPRRRHGVRGQDAALHQGDAALEGGQKA